MLHKIFIRIAGFIAFTVLVTSLFGLYCIAGASDLNNISIGQVVTRGTIFLIVLAADVLAINKLTADGEWRVD